ncbi:hypothetical protein KSF_069060 [Reticulibacter mediterranei]|uniref:PatA-like N-terminal domain-containing protein n=1 Tax=Reticulibacter mediterranei TaxID=2778369 RepID=A0A8J3IMP5_9CHLR|nr:DUF4388 domain-containing protein [Reticulibacter mediterranei]GHO96858.1 hypothetical protein KSF_069060 [Reticulibacter mediterranei]
MSMSQRRGTTTDNLNNVIQVIQLGRKTGVLTVERGHEATLEVGEITFVYGQITHAHIGELDGQIAVNVLCSWGLCRFLFTPSGSERSTGPIPSQPHASSRTTAPLKEIHTNISPPIPESRDYLSSDHTGIGQPRPFRTEQVDDALVLLEQAGLSRPHRHLLLLIDGQRTPLELVRLTGRPLEEIQRLLYDLERIGVISQ